MRGNGRRRLGVERLERRQMLATLRVAAIGDYGDAGFNAEVVAEMVRSWRPDAVLTLGDNNYELGGADTIDQNIGQFYHEFIGNYRGSYGAGSPLNRFFPTLGNHDWPLEPIGSAQPYFDYFTLPGAGFQNSSGNERYYDFVLGNVHFFALDSVAYEPHGTTFDSQQAEWLTTALRNSRQQFNLVFFHDAPYTSQVDSGNTVEMRWPFRAMGADAVLAASAHVYERLTIDGLPYFVNGLGGRPPYEFGAPHPNTEFRYNDDNGAMLITATDSGVLFEFYSVADPSQPVDRFVIGVVPEPSTAALLLAGVGGVWWAASRRGKQSAAPDDPAPRPTSPARGRRIDS